MNGPTQACCDTVATTMTDLSAEERDLVAVFCRYGREPGEIVDLIQTLRWQDLMAALHALKPRIADKERQHAKVLHDRGMSQAAILADIQAARDSRAAAQPTTRGPKV
jgi:hypothetical protein